MAAMEPRTGDGLLEAVKEGKKIVMCVLTDGGGCLVVELSPEGTKELGAEPVAVME